MRHIEFINADHFEKNYHRHFVKGRLSLFIDFFWQTKFETLWVQYPDNFSDALFPNLGYTFIINLGTPFDMQVAQNRKPVKSDIILPRLHHIECYHHPGNILFGIKFKVSPVLFEKKVNFSEYNGSVYPLSYLAEPSLLEKIKQAASFEKRIELLSAYYEEKLKQYESSLRPVSIVTQLLDKAVKQNRFNTSLELLAAMQHISPRTLHRYFLACTGVNAKQALQVLRIRTAVNHILSNPETFRIDQYGYYDYSHFYKHLKQFLSNRAIQEIKPHLQVLNSLKKDKAGKNTGPLST